MTGWRTSAIAEKMSGIGWRMLETARRIAGTPPMMADDATDLRISATGKRTCLIAARTWWIDGKMSEIGERTLGTAVLDPEGQVLEPAST